jgi:small-conductance mechanosensitive channel
MCARPNGSGVLRLPHPEVNTVTDSTTAEAQDAGADAAQDATTTSGQDSQATGFDALPPETQAEIRKLRRESAAYRKRVEEYESANQTEADKREAALKAAEDRAAALETRLRDLSARSAVTDAAKDAKAISTRAVYFAIRDDLEYDDDGTPTNVDSLIKQLVKEEPALFDLRAANGSGDGGKGGASQNVGNVNDLFREMARTAT